ncbi:hypothetical protein [Streptomyces sp. NPDC088789]|uniref:hypothetical protein n=1 Tax=Streptomyces sp. NPDC088789 TaxID=3365899 RepID=UPI003820EE4F
MPEPVAQPEQDEHPGTQDEHPALSLGLTRCSTPSRRSSVPCCSIRTGSTA